MTEDSPKLPPIGSQGASLRDPSAGPTSRISDVLTGQR